MRARVAATKIDPVQLRRVGDDDSFRRKDLAHVGHRDAEVHRCIGDELGVAPRVDLAGVTLLFELATDSPETAARFEAVDAAAVARSR